MEEHIFLSSVTAIVSPVLAERRYIPLFRSFNGGFPLAFANVPKLFLPSFATAVQTLMERIERPDFLEQSSPLLKTRPAAMKLPKEVNDRANLAFLWASVANSSPSVFWALYYILRDKQRQEEQTGSNNNNNNCSSNPTGSHGGIGAFRAVREEIDAIVDTLPSKDAADLTMDHLDQMVCLASVFQEVGRCQFGGFTVRDVVQDFVLETRLKEDPVPRRYLIRKGSRIMAQAAVQHFDEHVFANPHEFIWDRFLQTKNGKGPVFVDRNGRQVPFPTMQFGMGSKVCPGRRFQEYELKAYVALLLSRFDVRLSGEERFLPVPGPEKLSHGIAINNPDRSVAIELRLRKR